MYWSHVLLCSECLQISIARSVEVCLLFAVQQSLHERGRGASISPCSCAASPLDQVLGFESSVLADQISFFNVVSAQLYTIDRMDLS